VSAEQPPPGWVERVRWLRGIVDRADAELQAAGPNDRTWITRQKIDIAEAHLRVLLAMRPKSPRTHG
jgi:hypothetical protein